MVLGTLVVQGLTLRPLILALKFEEDDPVAREAAQARCIAYRAALEEIDGDPSEEAEILRLEYRAVLLRAETEPELGIASSELPADPLRRRAIGAAREALLKMRHFEEISDDAFHQVEEELDRAELGAQADQKIARHAPDLLVMPPSTTSSIPVTYFDSSDARNSAALATSQASPMCPIGTCASRARHIASTSPLA